MSNAMNCFVPVFTQITSFTTLSFFLYILSENVWEKPNSLTIDTHQAYPMMNQDALLFK
jgi:hypothetical protein